MPIGGAREGVKQKCETEVVSREIYAELKYTEV